MGLDLGRVLKTYITFGATYGGLEIYLSPLLDIIVLLIRFLPQGGIW